MNISTWRCREQEKAPRWVSPPYSLGSNQSHQQPKGFGGRVIATTAEPRARRPAQSCLCGGQKKWGFIAGNIGPLCAAFLALCRGTAAVYMAALDGAGTLHSSERPFCKCQRATLSGRHRRLRGPVAPAEGPPCCWESRGSPAWGCAVSSGCPPATTRRDLGGWEGGSHGKSTMAPESNVGWAPLRFGMRRSGKSIANCKISTSNSGSRLPRASPGDHGSKGMGWATSMEEDTSMGKAGRWD